MTLVYKITHPNGQTTRLHLPQTAWAKDVLDVLDRCGYPSQVTDQAWYPDTRDEAELARRDALLNLAAPIL